MNWNIPEKNPFTIDDILNCKKFDEKILIKDYQSLINFKADINPRKFCGNKIIYQHQFPHLLNCRRDTKNYKTIYEYFKDETLKEKLWKETIHRNRRDDCPIPSATDIYECHRLNNGAIVPFKSSTAKYIYKKYGATSILDPTAGWGGRLLGASSLGLKYVGYDTNLKLKDGYEKMIDLLNIKNCEMRWESSQEQDFSDIEYDMILTSPPYINLELYEGMTPFENEKEFYYNWLIPLLGNAYEGLSDGGHMCINISPKMYKKLIHYGHLECDFKEDLRQQLGKQYKTKSQDYIYIWEK